MSLTMDRAVACSETFRFATSRVEELDRKLLAAALREADAMRPAWRASKIPQHDASRVTALFADMLRVGWVVGVPVSTPAGSDFIVAGLTEKGRRVLTIIDNTAAWMRLKAAAMQSGMWLDVEGIAELISREGDG